MSDQSTAPSDTLILELETGGRVVIRLRPDLAPDAVERLQDVAGVGVTFLNKSDIVRHALVQAIVNAYESTEPARETGSGAGTGGDAVVTPDHAPPPGPAASE